MSNLVDTLMNIEVFAFIGLLVWLYFKPAKPDAGEGSSASREPRGDVSRK